MMLALLFCAGKDREDNKAKRKDTKHFFITFSNKLPRMDKNLSIHGNIF